MKKLIPALVLAVLLPSCDLFDPPGGGGTPPPPCELVTPFHIWGDGINAYHLGHDNLSPLLVNSSSYTPDAESWNDLGTPITLELEGSGFPLTIIDGGNLQSGWLGLASISIDAKGHIQSGEVTMNKSILDDYSTNTAAHVLCQEIGHLLGLEHNRQELDTCMNDCQPPATDFRACLNLDFGTTPNAHDAETLNEVYAHAADPPIPPCSAGVVILHTFDVLPSPVDEPAADATADPEE